MASSPAEMAIFERVAERGSFAGAAEDVSLSPSAVAKLITRLEQRLGVRLINRTTRRLALTAEGEIYLDRGREILGAIEAAEIAAAHASPRGHLRVHTFPLIAAHELAPALPEFLASELCSLRWEQVDLAHGRLHVSRAKSGIPSVHPLTGTELRALRRLQRER